jgi:hypothetical protein
MRETAFEMRLHEGEDLNSRDSIKRSSQSQGYRTPRSHSGKNNSPLYKVQVMRLLIRTLNARKMAGKMVP